jgi:hypothetical protein
VHLHQQTLNPGSTNIPVSEIFYHLLDSTVPNSSLSCHFSDCYMPILSDKLFSFSFVSLGTDSLEANTTGLITDISFLSLKCFTHLLTLPVQMQSSPYAHYSHASISNVGIPSLIRNFISAHCQKTMSSSAKHSH